MKDDPTNREPSPRARRTLTIGHVSILVVGLMFVGVVTYVTGSLVGSWGVGFIVPIIAGTLFGAAAYAHIRGWTGTYRRR